MAAPGSGSSSKEENAKSSSPNDQFFAVKITGSPQDASEGDVRAFLSDCSVEEVLFNGDRSTTGPIIYVKLVSQDDFNKACAHDGHPMRWQKVEVSCILQSEYDAVANKDLQATSGSTNSDANYNCVRLRGLPWAATATDIIQLLHDVRLKDGEKSVNFSFGPDGRASGEAFVEVCSAEEVGKALNHNREHLGGRYIEIFRASRAQMEWECRVAERVVGDGGVVRLRGLPFGCTEQEVRLFFSGLIISQNGITVQRDEVGKETGEAFVEFNSSADAEKALERNKCTIGHRYIEVFRSTHAEIRPVLDHSTWRGGHRSSPYPSRGRFGGGPPGGRYGSGYERQYRGRGGGMRGGRGADYHGYNDGGYGGQYYMDNGSYQGGYQAPPPEQPGGARHAVRLRGLPYSAEDGDITNFFAPLVVVRIDIERDSLGRPSGAAEVEFQTHQDALEAMKKDRQHIGSRYIELFLQSHAGGGGSGGYGHQGNVRGPRGPPRGQYDYHSYNHGYGPPQQQQQYAQSYPQQPGYAQQQYAPQQQQPGYAQQQQPGYASQQQQQPGYAHQQQPGYAVQQPGYSQQGGYMQPQQPGYSQQQQGSAAYPPQQGSSYAQSYPADSQHQPQSGYAHGGYS